VKKILSIDGGGIRGIIPGQVLITLEEKLKRISKNPNARLSDYFDFMAGTSTGGILACLYLSPSNISAADAVDLYKRYGNQIFNLSIWGKIRTFGGILGEKYKASKLEECLKLYFGDMKLSALLKPCLIPAFDIEHGAPFFFTQHDAVSRGSEYDYLVRDVCRAASAAPTYFEIACISAVTKTYYPLVDGGIFANNPSMCAYAEMRDLIKGSSTLIDPMAHSTKNMFILSLGTGSSDIKLCYDKARRWGSAQWVRPLIDMMMNYTRINPTHLDSKHTNMDDASSDNIKYLIELGKQTAIANDEVLEKIAITVINDL